MLNHNDFALSAVSGEVIFSWGVGWFTPAMAKPSIQTKQGRGECRSSSLDKLITSKPMALNKKESCLKFE